MGKKIIFGSNLKDVKDDHEPICVEYDYFPGVMFGKKYEEEYINIFRGTKHIFISRDCKAEKPDENPVYIICETDTKTRKQKRYIAELTCEREITEHEALTFVEEKEMMIEENIHEEN